MAPQCKISCVCQYPCPNNFPAMHGPYSLINGGKDGVWNQYTGDGILLRVRRLLPSRRPPSRRSQVTLFARGKRNGVQTSYVRSSFLH